MKTYMLSVIAELVLSGCMMAQHHRKSVRDVSGEENAKQEPGRVRQRRWKMRHRWWLEQSTVRFLIGREEAALIVPGPMSPGTRRVRRMCGYTPTISGDYRLVMELSIHGDR